LTRPNTAGSEPIGNNVADTSATTNTVDSPNCGNANHCNTSANQASMRRILP